MPDPIRPTKKQRELMVFIQNFIAEHGYGPSYREIMAGCNYTSVATVALHVNNLVARGHLRKKDRSARSLELVKSTESITPDDAASTVKPADEKWLVEKIEQKFAVVEAEKVPDPKETDGLYVLVGALKVLGLEGAAQSFIPRLSNLRKKAKEL